MPIIAPDVTPVSNAEVRLAPVKSALVKLALVRFALGPMR